MDASRYNDVLMPASCFRVVEKRPVTRRDNRRNSCFTKAPIEKLPGSGPLRSSVNENSPIIAWNTFWKNCCGIVNVQRKLMQHVIHNDHCVFWKIDIA